MDKIDGNQVLYETLTSQKVDLLEFIIQASFFIEMKSVEKDKTNMISDAEKGEKLYIRYKTKIREIEKLNDKKSIGKKSLALKYQKEHCLNYVFNKNKFPILFDSDGNYELRKKIQKYTGFLVSGGNKQSDYINYKISHIWDNTSHPFYFSSLWNIIIVPKCLDHFIDDKNITIDHDSFPNQKLNTKMFFKALVTVLYNLEKYKEKYSCYFNDDKIDKEYITFAKLYKDKINYLTPKNGYQL